MGYIRKLIGKWGENFKWAGSRSRSYEEGSAADATETWIIGKAEAARNFALRYYELEVGGSSNREAHPHDHGVVFLRGQGKVLLGEERHEVMPGDIVYITPNETHEIANTGQDKLGWFCIIPAFRDKQGNPVWAEDGLELITITE